MSGSVDRILEGVAGIFEQAFPGRIRGVYVRGSHASGHATPGSDIDLFVVFESDFVDRAESQRTRAIGRHCAQLCPVLLEILVVSEGQLRDQRDVALALALKLSTRLVSGVDIRPDLPELDPDSYVRSVIHTPYFSYVYPVQRQNPLGYPLEHIDPDGPFLGFDQWQVPGPDGAEIPSTKLLVGTVGWTATAIIALRTGLYVRDKAECVRLYAEHIADEWTELVVGVHGHCRSRWQYRVPTEPADRRTLRELCERALPFQNHFLRQYRDYQLAELRSGEPERQRLAAERLRTIVFPDDEARTALDG